MAEGAAEGLAEGAAEGSVGEGLNPTAGSGNLHPSEQQLPLGHPLLDAAPGGVHRGAGGAVATFSSSGLFEFDKSRSGSGGLLTEAAGGRLLLSPTLSLPPESNRGEYDEAMGTEVFLFF